MEILYNKEGYPTIDEFLYTSMSEGETLGFDGRLISVKEGAKLESKLVEKNIKISYEYDLINNIWENRPLLSDSKAFLLDVKYAGESFSSKLHRLREKMKEKSVTTHIITTLYDIAWLFNIRGRVLNILQLYFLMH